MVSARSSALPCEQLSRATDMPAWMRATMVSTLFEAGPMVQMIFVRREVMQALHPVEAGLFLHEASRDAGPKKKSYLRRFLPPQPQFCELIGSNSSVPSGRRRVRDSTKARHDEQKR